MDDARVLNAMRTRMSSRGYVKKTDMMPGEGVGTPQGYERVGCAPEMAPAAKRRPLVCESRVGIRTYIADVNSLMGQSALGYVRAQSGRRQ